MVPGSIVRGITVDPSLPNKMEISEQWSVQAANKKDIAQPGDKFMVPCFLESRANIMQNLHLFVKHPLANGNIVYVPKNDDTEAWVKQLFYSNAFTKLALPVGEIVGMYLGVQFRINNSSALYILLPNGTGIWI